MKKVMNRVCALLLGTAMAAGLLAGCGNSGGGSASNVSSAVEEKKEEKNAGTEQETAADFSGAEIDLSEHVNLTMWLVGDKPDAYGDMLAALNEILEEKLNCSLAVEWLSWSEYETKYSLLFQGGEDFDLIYTATDWCYYEQTVSMGGFLELTEELIKTYAPDVWATYPELAWEQSRINNSIYMIPANFQTPYVITLALRGDLMEKYGYKDITAWDELISFYKDCAVEGMYAITTGNLLDVWAGANSLTSVSGTPQSGQLIYYNVLTPDDPDVLYALETDEFKEFCHTVKELADAGCWSSDILNNMEEYQDGLLNGKAAGMIWNMGTSASYANQANREHPDWNTNIYTVTPAGSYTATKFIDNGMAIYAGSKNPERAMMVLNLLNTDQEVQDLTILGIEGVNWEAVDDSTYKSLETYEASNCWGWAAYPRTLYNESPTVVDEKYAEMKEYTLENLSKDHILDGFAFDATGVTTQVAAVEAAMGTYWTPLLCGMVTDVDAAMEQMLNALDAAGMQDILDELQSQIDAYAASHN